MELKSSKYIGIDILSKKVKIAKWILIKDKIKKVSSIDNSLLSLLKRKYPQHDIEEKDYNIILNHLEEFIIDLNNKNLINKFVDNIIEEVLNGR